MNTQPVIKAINLSKDFKTNQALRGINLEISPGSVIGVLGPNGSGKTTFFKHIIGLLQASRGGVETFGTDATQLSAKQLGSIGYVSQQSELLDWLTVRETIDFTEAHYINWDENLANTLLEKFELKDNSNVGSLSVGQKQRLSIVLAISHRPKLLILDEPAASLDPVVRQDFLDLLMEFIQDPDRTILISSHILTDVQKIIDKVLILDKGLVHCFQDLDDLREEYFHITLRSLNGNLPAEIQLTGLKHMDHQGTSAVVKIHNPDAEQVRQEVEKLNCQSSINRLEFEDIYRLIVAGK